MACTAPIWIKASKTIPTPCRWAAESFVKIGKRKVLYTWGRKWNVALIFYIFSPIHIQFGIADARKSVLSDRVSWKSVQQTLHLTYGCKYISIRTFNIYCLILVEFGITGLNIMLLSIGEFRQKSAQSRPYSFISIRVNAVTRKRVPWKRKLFIQHKCLGEVYVLCYRTHQLQSCVHLESAGSGKDDAQI
jgi:hypothetical protein